MPDFAKDQDHLTDEEKRRRAAEFDRKLDAAGVVEDDAYDDADAVIVVAPLKHPAEPPAAA